MENGNLNGPAGEQGKKLGFTYFKPVGRIVLIFFIGLSFYLFISSVILLLLTRPDREVRVPGVTGKQFTDVYNSLMRHGLKPEIEFLDVNDVNDGLILDQYPEGGEIVYEGNTLKLVVSRSIILIDVPNLVGIELPFARNKLKNLHSHNRTVSLRVGVVSYIPSEKTADNIVIDQSPRAGMKVTPDRKVNLLVSAGKIQPDMLMPEVAGQSIDLCLDLLLAKGLYVAQEVLDTGEEEKSGIIDSQNPAKGAPVNRGNTVQVRVHHYKSGLHPYRSYERVDYDIDRDGEAGLYEAYIEDGEPRRIAFSKMMKPGQKISFVFHRTGDARVDILHNKKAIKVIKIDVEESL